VIYIEEDRSFSIILCMKASDGVNAERIPCVSSRTCTWSPSMGRATLENSEMLEFNQSTPIQHSQNGNSPEYVARRTRNSSHPSKLFGFLSG